MSDSKNERTQNVEDIDIDNMDHANTAVIDNSTDADSKETILRRLKKALRLAAKLQTKLEFEKEVSKELARRNEVFKKEKETGEEEFENLRESFLELYHQFDDLLLRYDEILSGEKPAKGSASYLECTRDYDDKIDFLRNVYARSGVGAEHKGNDRDFDQFDDKSVNLLNMSGSSFFRSSLQKKESPIDEEIQKLQRDKQKLSQAKKRETVRKIDNLHKIMSPAPPAPFSSSSSTPLTDGSSSGSGSFLSIYKTDSISSTTPDTNNTTTTPASPSPHFTSAPLFEHFLVIGVSLDSSAHIAEQIIKKTARLSDKFKNQIKLFANSKKTDVEEEEGEDSAPLPVPSARSPNTWYSQPAVLYRHPPDADSPPPEVCDFCLPAGGKLRFLSTQADKEQSTLQLLYGNGQTQRSSRCFIFMLEDKTLNIVKNVPNEETGEHTGRLFGICVVTPRILKPSAPVNNHPHSRHLKPPGTTEVIFETAVCYCFITRFPLFDFFFQSLWNIIAFERISRMIEVAEKTNSSLAEPLELDFYRYIPENVFDTVMSRLSLLKPPRFGENLTLHIDSSLRPVTTLRTRGESGHPEHFQNAAEWALPPLLHWLDAKTVVWVLSLLLMEVKLIIIGKDAASVSCAVIGLTSLLKPFKWVSPMIPILPIKHLDFIESPVPIIAGVVVDNDCPNLDSLGEESITPLNILQQCNDGEVVAVLDLAARDLYTLTEHRKSLAELFAPGAESLIEQMESIITTSGVARCGSALTYDVSRVHRENFLQIQCCVNEHMKVIAEGAKKKAKDIVDNKVKAAEEKVTAQLKQLSSLKENKPPERKKSLTASLFGSVGEEGKEEVSDDDQNDFNDVSASDDSDLHGSAKVFGAANVIPILSLNLMKCPPARKKYTTKFYERFISTQTYSEYDFEFEMLLQSVEAAVTGATDLTSDDAITIVSSRPRSMPRKSVITRASPRKSVMVGAGGQRKARSRSLYVAPEDMKEHEELRIVQQFVSTSSASVGDSSDDKPSSTRRPMQRVSRAVSDGQLLFVKEETAENDDAD